MKSYPFFIGIMFMSVDINVVNITEIKYDPDKEEIIITADGYKGQTAFTNGKIKFYIDKANLSNVHEKIRIGPTSQTIKGVLVLKDSDS